MLYGGGCRCGKHMLVQDGICLWCGRGTPSTPKKSDRPARLRRLPRDLGAFQREGRRPDPQLDNVVRLDRLRETWKVPSLTLLLPEPDQCECGCGEPVYGTRFVDSGHASRLRWINERARRNGREAA